PHTGVDPHPHSERAVLWIVLDGEGAVTVDGRARAVGAGWGALIPAGRERSVTAGRGRGPRVSGPLPRRPGGGPGGGAPAARTAALVAALLGGRTCARLATIEPDGGPSSRPIWVDVEGDRVI